MANVETICVRGLHGPLAAFYKVTNSVYWASPTSFLPAVHQKKWILCPWGAVYAIVHFEFTTAAPPPPWSKAGNCPLWRQLDQLNSMGRGLRQSWTHNVQLQPWGHHLCDKYHCFFLCVKSIGPEQHFKHVLMQGPCEDANWNCWWEVLKAWGWVHARWMQKLWWCEVWQAIVDVSLWENLV